MPLRGGTKRPTLRCSSQIDARIDALQQMPARRELFKQQPKAEAAMVIRVAIVCACLLAIAPAVAEELGPDQARTFLLDKTFDFTCTDGTNGMGRMLADGAVVGWI